MPENRNTWDWALKITLLILLGILFFWVCCRTYGAMPPVPKKVLQSPKGAEQAASWQKVPSAPMVVVIPSKGLMWDYVSTTNNPSSNICFIVISTTNLIVPRLNWTTRAVVATNGWGPFLCDKPMEFFTVRSSNVVTHLTSL
jgi:hypothetical protein